MGANDDLPVFREADADISVLAGKTITIVGYGHLGRSLALNFRDATKAKVIIGSRKDDSRDLAEKEGFPIFDIGEAVAQADLTLLLVPDETQPEVMEGSVRANLRPGSALLFASGYNLAYDLIALPQGVDVLLFAPRMVGDVIRDLFVAEKGFLSYVSVEQDATGNAWPTLLAVASAAGSLRRGALKLSAKQEANLDLFGEQALGPWLGAAILAAYQVGLEAGLPPEGLLLEMYLSGEMSKTFQAMSDSGFFRSVYLHGYAAAFGGMTRTMAVDRDVMMETMREAVKDIQSGAFAEELQAEIEAGYPSRAFLDEMLGDDNEINRIEDNLRRKLGLDEG
ncbi:MAG: ketol-acid reductoisomerase [Chloroflexi bacterium]|jgi:ketol-acid reductoisomerase|nr:MAG: ketol-acid reductoisomerase [Chloroflexota bacterium]